MTPICTNSELSKMQKQQSILSVDAQRLPSKIFPSSVSHFSFLAFDRLFMRSFFVSLAQFCEQNGNSHFYLATSKPDATTYYFKHFGFYGAFEFEVTDTADDFVSAINNVPIDSPADALIHSAIRIDFFSSDGKWRLHGDRDSQIAVCGFSELLIREQFEHVFSGDILLSAENAAPFSRCRANPGAS